MATKKKSEGRHALRIRVMRAHAEAAVLLATLGEAVAIVDSDAAANLAIAVQALRAIAGANPSTDARWTRGLAIGALKRIKVATLAGES